MIQVNHQAIREWCEQICEQLLVDYSHWQTSANRAEMFERFSAANHWAEEKFKAAFIEHYPEVHWSDAELDFDKQKHPEYQGAYWVLDAIDAGIHLHHGFAFWSMSLCLVEDGQTTFAMTASSNLTPINSTLE